MKTLIASMLVLLALASAHGTDTVIYAEDPRVDFILMKLRAAATGKTLRDLAREEFRSELNAPESEAGQQHLAAVIEDFAAQAATIDPATITVRRHVKLAIDYYDQEAGRFVFRNATASAKLNRQIDYRTLFPEPFTGSRPAATREAKLGLTVQGQNFSLMFSISPAVAQKWMQLFDQCGAPRVDTMRYFEADFDYRLVAYKHGGAGSDWFLAEVRRMVLIDPVVNGVIMAIDWEGGQQQDIADTIPDDYSEAEEQARHAIPKAHTHNVPVPQRIG